MSKAPEAESRIQILTPTADYTELQTAKKTVVSNTVSIALAPNNKGTTENTFQIT